MAIDAAWKNYELKYNGKDLADIIEVVATIDKMPLTEITAKEWDKI